MSNKELSAMSQEMFNSTVHTPVEQDDAFDQISGIVQNIKHGQEAIGEETDLQMKLLDEAENEVDKTTANISSADTKLKALIQTTSSWKLWLIIGIELGGIVAMIFLIL